MSHPLIQSIWLLPCYTLIGAVLATLWLPGVTQLTGPRPAGYVNAIMTLTAFVHALLALITSWGQPAVDFSLPWLQVAGLDLSVPVHVDSTALGATVLITGLNLAAQIFAIGYLEMDWGWARFFSLLALFEAGMTVLVLTDSLFFGYMALEILTLGTYLLIGLWFNQSLVVTGARDAFLTKRIGDLFLLMGVVALLPLAGTWRYSELAVWAQGAGQAVPPWQMTLVGMALLAGPIGKCAQFPLHLWLDEAMEGPVPGSILRNAVVVQVGVWVLVKLEPVLALSPTVMHATVLIGAITALGGAGIAIAQIDFKRTLSYPTSVAMGLIFIAVGTGNPRSALLLGLSHGLGMALMVMSSSAVVWNAITQDITQLGGLWQRRPVSALGFLVGAASVTGFPLLGGFWAMLELLSPLWPSQPGVVAVVLVVNGLLAFGFTRVFCRVFLGQPALMATRCPEVPWLLALPMMTMVGLVLHLPLILQALGLLPDWLLLNRDLALLLVWSTLLGLSLSAVVYCSNSIAKPVRLPWAGVQDLFSYDFYTPQLYQSSVVLMVKLLADLVAAFDHYVVDGLANLFGLVTLLSGQGLKYSNSGQFQFYMLTIVIGVSMLGLWFSFPIWSMLKLSI
jgi:NAD(P)H-quinone oxidoreductase subunit 5